MACYITYGEIQHYLKEHYMKTGSGMQFSEMVDYLKCQRLLSEEYRNTHSKLENAFIQGKDSLKDKQKSHKIGSFLTFNSLECTNYLSLSSWNARSLTFGDSRLCRYDT